VRCRLRTLESPGETVELSCHYLDRLRTGSGHELVRHEDPADPIGLIAIHVVVNMGLDCVF
jgi:hypothetical protein